MAVNDDKRKLFVGGLGLTVTTETLKQYFSRFGPVEKASIILDKHSGKPRGFGFIIMHESAGAFRALGVPHTLKGKQLDCRRAFPKDSHSGKKQCRKIFVGGLLSEVSQEEFSSYFESYGPISDSIVMKNKQSGKPRCFGFVTFCHQYSVDQVVSEYSTHRLRGKWVECKLATPKEEFAEVPMSPGSTQASRSPLDEPEEICMKVLHELLDDEDDWLI